VGSVGYGYACGATAEPLGTGGAAVGWAEARGLVGSVGYGCACGAAAEPLGTGGAAVVWQEFRRGTAGGGSTASPLAGMGRVARLWAGPGRVVWWVRWATGMIGLNVVLFVLAGVEIWLATVWL
jgi:hypothetical protein